MPTPCQTSRWRHYVFRTSVRSFVRHQTCEHGILKTTEPIMMPIGTCGPWYKWRGHETINFGGQEVKVQGHTRPQIGLHLQAWRRHHFRPRWVEQLFQFALLLLLRILLNVMTSRALVIPARDRHWSQPTYTAAERCRQQPACRSDLTIVWREAAVTM